MPRFMNFRNFVAAIAFVAVSSLTLAETHAHGQGLGGMGFLPYGFYQPYGAQYGTSLRTPPYFATNPPVYYGARHTRPYGVSPFAAPPMVSAGSSYRSHRRSDFIAPRTFTNPPTIRLQEGCGSCLSDPSQDGSSIKLGQVQTNPFFIAKERIAKK